MNDYKIEVEKLKNEIFNLKADKDFVWSLWKRLQLSSPDLAEAVNIISQREKEKTSKEHLDIKKMLECRDEKLINMQVVLDKKNSEIEVLSKRNQEIMIRCSKFEQQCADLAEKASKLDDLMSNMDTSDQRQLINDYEDERHQLSQSVSQLQAKVTILTDEKAKMQLALVKSEEKLKCQEELQNYVVELRHQLEQANEHIDTQQQTIRMMRDQMEKSIKYSPTEDGYSSDRSVEYRNNDQMSQMDDNGRPTSPIVDLNYKVDQLGLHMKHLQDCISHKSSGPNVARSKSMPPRKNHKQSMRNEQVSRKMQFLEQKLSKTEKLFEEEKKAAASNSDFLEKANKRVKSSQLTIKQLRQQVEDSRTRENEWKMSAGQLEKEMEMCRREIQNRETETQKMQQNSINDAVRIQDLLGKLENMRDELTERNVKLGQESGGEIERLRQLVQQLEREKCLLEMQSGGAGIIDGRRHPISVPDAAHRQRSTLVRNRRSKANMSNGHNRVRQVGNKKTINMSTILNHFSDNNVNGTDVINDDEWEDEETEEEETANTESSTTTRSCMEHNSYPSTGSVIARVASINQCCDKGDTLTHRKTEAKHNHITRMQKTKEKSFAEMEAAVAKSRAASLEQQLKSVIASRDAYEAKFKVIQSQMKILNEDLSQSKLRCSRLIDAIKKQSSRYQVVLEERKQLLSGTDAGNIQEAHHKEFGLDMEDIGPVLQPYLGEMSTNVAICRELQQELARRDSDLLQVREKLSKAERDNSCKKRIIDDLKTKMQTVDGEKDREKKIVENKDKRINELEGCNFKMKTQVESLQARFHVVLEERRRFEQEYSNLTAKLDAAENKLAELRHAKNNVESRLSKIDENHENQMTSVISRSGSALDKASMQIQNLKMRGSKYERLVVNLAKDFYQKIREIRRLVEFGQKKFNSLEARTSASDMPKGFEFARNKAADILSLSTSEIDYLLNGTSESIKCQRKSQQNNSAVEECLEFPQKCRQAFKNRTFDEEIQAMFADKLEELAELVVPASSDSGCVSCS